MEGEGSLVTSDSGFSILCRGGVELHKHHPHSSGGGINYGNTNLFVVKELLSGGVNLKRLSRYELLSQDFPFP